MWHSHTRWIPSLAGMAIGMALFGTLSAQATPPATQPTSQALRWDQRHLPEYPIYCLLLKRDGVGNGLAEPRQWEWAETRKPLDDDTREPALRALLKKYPDSDYADDAALLLARARLFYHDDAKGAIEQLYAVAAKYPQGHWIAEDAVFLLHAFTPNVTRAGEPCDSWFSLPPEERGLSHGWKTVKYMAYLEQHPNSTADEAHYWIAWIIARMQLQHRYPEAEKLLTGMIEAHRAERRTEKDAQAAESLHNDIITEMMSRPERASHQLLIELYLLQGDHAKAKAAIADYLVLHKGHASCEGVSRMDAKPQK